MTPDLSRLFHPKSIAVIGGGAWCENLIMQCRKLGYSGDIWPIHPTKTMIGGQPAYRHLNELPTSPDASFIGVNRLLTVEMVRELSAMKAGGAVCFSSGFQEASHEGAALERTLLAAAGEMPIIGPNCYGFLNLLDRAALWPDQHGCEPVERGVAIVTQSSNIAINLTMQQRGLPIGFVATAGNQAQLGFAQIAEGLLQDPRITVLGLHIEGVDDVDALRRLAERAHGVGKSIVALKVGRSAEAQAATISHTASLAGSEAGSSALFRRLGIFQVHSLAGFLECLKLLHVVGPLRSSSIASASCSGGEASLIADMAHERQLPFPPLTKTQEAELGEVLGPLVTLSNPLDYHTFIWGDIDAMARCFSVLLRGDIGICLIILDFPRSDRCDAAEWDKVISAIKRAKTGQDTPIAIVASLPETMPEAVAKHLIEAGIMAFAGLAEAIEAIDVASTRNPPDFTPVLVTPPDQTHGAGGFSEYEAKEMLNAHGIRIPRSMRGDNLETLLPAVNHVGFPLVLKGEGFAHKSEAGAVVLNIQNREELAAAAFKMAAPGYLIEEMVSDVICELLLGVTYDPAHGYVLTLAAGGVLTEILQDSASLLLPTTRSQMRDALFSLKISPLLRGFRGAKQPNIDAILDAIEALQSFAMAQCFCEIEINPLMITEDEAIAADALISIGDQR